MSEMPWSLLSPFSQTIDKFFSVPITSWQRFYNPQVVFNYNPQDEPVEAHVLSKVGSYGAQLSTIIDMIDLLSKKLDPAALSPAEGATVREFQDLRTRARTAVDEARGETTPDAILASIDALAKRRPEELAALRAKIEQALAAKTAPTTKPG